ncbi:hypothetical protein EIP86_010378 [Pleurotus ostreatoroseus]|nr:hypothetical protein EIP86_010378 [Pleurotus ostreatoroseus]
MVPTQATVRSIGRLFSWYVAMVQELIRTRLNQLTGMRTRHEIETPYGPSRELTTRYFFDHILPPLRHGLDPAQVVTTLKSSRQSVFAGIITKQDRWRGFPKDPAQCGNTLYHAFKHLEGVVKAVRASVKASGIDCIAKDTDLSFKSNPDAELDRQEDSFPDACFWRESEHTWKNIAACGEYQKGDSSEDIDENVEKVTHSMAKLMFENPGRRFAIGFSIENVNMRIWFCDRRNILVSQSFHFITNPQYVVHFFLSILYAEPHQLGWDPTMTLLPDGHNFDIMVTSGKEARTYRTKEILSDRGSRELLGKASRVWKAVRMEDGEETGPVVVLKDCWPKLCDPREGEIIRCIRKILLDQRESKSIESLFLNVEWDGDTLIRTDVAFPDSTLIVNANSAQRSTNRKEAAGISAESRLVHYRVVISPVSTGSLHGQTSLPTIYKSLSHMTRALRAMHKAGWVHRDISTGNILVDDGQAVLADFELATQASDDSNFHLGTEYFKSVEVGAGSYCFLPRPKLKPLELEDLSTTKAEMLAMALRGLSPAKSDSSSPSRPRSSPSSPVIQVPIPERERTVIVPLRYSPLHDLESLWWVAVYFALKREISMNSTETSLAKHAAEWSREAQRTYADKLFFGQDFRLMTISTSGKFFNNGHSVVHPVLHPVIAILDFLRDSLMARYTEIEKDVASIDRKCADGLYDIFIAGFSEIADRHQLQDVHLVPIPDSYSAASPPAIATREDHNVVEETKDAQATRSDVGKGEKTKRRRRKPVAQTHRYNLRPRPRRA